MEQQMQHAASASADQEIRTPNTTHKPTAQWMKTLEHRATFFFSMYHTELGSNP